MIGRAKTPADYSGCNHHKGTNDSCHHSVHVTIQRTRTKTPSQANQQKMQQVASIGVSLFLQQPQQL